MALKGSCTRQKVMGMDGKGKVWGPWPWVLEVSEEVRLTLGRLGDRQYSSVGLLDGKVGCCPVTPA